MFEYGVSDNSVPIPNVQSQAYESICPRKPLMDCGLKANPAVQGM
jgi:hypothetical protein